MSTQDHDEFKQARRAAIASADLITVQAFARKYGQRVPRNEQELRLFLSAPVWD